MQREIKHTFFFHQAPELVWDYLTKPELLSQWLMPNDIKAEVGHQFMFKTKPRIKFGFDGNVYCEVTEVRPFTRFSYSWKGGANGKITLDSIVVWTLTPKNNGTELTLEHKGFKGIKNFFGYVVMNAGWKKIGKRMQELLNNSTK